MYKQILEILKPGESVLKAVRRLGGVKSKATGRDRWRKEKKKAKDEEENAEDMQVLFCTCTVIEPPSNLKTFLSFC